MDIRIDPRLTNGLTADITQGSVSVSPENLVTFSANAGGVIRRTRWIMVQPGETIVATVEMRGGPNTSIRLYESTGSTTENLLGYVESDSFTSLKLHSISYTLPITSPPKLIGVGFFASSGAGRFFRPTITKTNNISASPQLISSGLINMTNGLFSTSFPNNGVASSEFSNNKVKVTLSHKIKNSSVRPLPFAMDVTPSVFQHGNRIVCSDISVTGDVVTFDVYYVDSSGSVVQPPANTSAQFLVYY